MNTKRVSVILAPALTLDGNGNRRKLTLFGVLVVVLLLAGLAVPVPILKATGADEQAATTQPVGQEKAIAQNDNDAPIFDIPRVDGVVIDGKADDWSDRGFRHEALAKTIIPNLPPEDFDVRFRLGWDDRGLLVLLVVRDDSRLEAPQGEGLWRGDCVHLFMAAKRGSEQRWHVNITPGVDASNPEVRQDIQDQRTDGELRKTKLLLEVERTRTDDGYVIEALMGWKNLGIEPALGREIAVQIGVSDLDKGETSRGIRWYPDKRSWRHPGLMYRLRLASKPSAAILTVDHKLRERIARIGGKTPWKGTRSLEVDTVDKNSGQALPDVALKIYVSQQGGRSYWTERTDVQGQCRITLPDDPSCTVVIEAEKDGFVPLSIYWRGEAPETKLPASFTLAMEAGTSIGGIVQDEQGQPIEGVRVFLSVSGRRTADRVGVRISNLLVATDEDGRWRCDMIPADPKSVSVRLAHPDYISDPQFTRRRSPPIDKLRDSTCVIVIKKGMTLAGTVTDLEGRPIADASVSRGDHRTPQQPDLKTDAEGRFGFKGHKAGRVVLTVEAEGYAPELKEIDFGPDTPPVEFKLSAGKTLRGRVVDPQGKPVEGATIWAALWRGHRSLEYVVYTDADGRFEWRSAPADEVVFSIDKSGYMPIQNQRLVAGDEEHVITIATALRVRGSVVDAKTGEPIDEFTVIPGIDWGRGDPPSWQRSSRAKTFTQGKYETSFTWPHPFRLIRIEAEGYAPAISRTIKSDEGEVVIDFKLEKSAGLTGVVLGLDGKPLAGANVLLSTPSAGASIRKGATSRPTNCPSATTDAEGRFTLPAEIDPYRLVVVHESGYVEVGQEELAQSDQIKLQPWGRIEGTLHIGRKPGAKERIWVLWPASPHERNTPRIRHDTEATTDEAGHFTIERVPPGEIGVSWNVQTSPGRWSSARYVRVTVEAGRTAHVKLGGIGRPVIGRVLVPAGHEDRINWDNGRYYISTKFDLPKPPTPEGWVTMDSNARWQWHGKWKQSEEGKAFGKHYNEFLREQKHFRFQVKPDGTFRAEDIPAGTYRLGISVHEPPTQGDITCGYGKRIGSISQEFTVPEMPGGRSDEPLDLGELELTLQKRMKVGDEAPLFEAKTLDGKPLKLADYRGKYVLLDFWATWCGPCPKETPYLKAVHEAFGSDEQFVIIGLSLDKDVKDPKQYAETSGLKWIQGFLGDWSKTKVPATYGVRGIPSIFLIDPEGKIVAKGLRGAEIMRAVQNALGTQGFEPGWRERFEATYRLEDEQVLKRIAPPFIPERRMYYITEATDQAAASAEPPDYFTFHWDGGLSRWGGGFGRKRTLYDVLVSSLGLPNYQVQGPKELLRIELPGDWIVRKGANQEDKLKALEQILRAELGRVVHFEQRQVRQDVIIARGRFEFHPQPGAHSDEGVHIYAEKLDDNMGSGGGSGDISKFLRRVGSRLNLRIIDETEGYDGKFMWHYNHDSHCRRMGHRRDELTDKVLKNLSRQTSLSFSKERREVLVWFVTEETSQAATPGTDAKGAFSKPAAARPASAARRETFRQTRFSRPSRSLRS